MVATEKNFIVAFLIRVSKKSCIIAEGVTYKLCFLKKLREVGIFGFETR